VGCVPSKLFIAAADVAHAIRKTSGFGIHVGDGFRIDGHEVMDCVRRERDRFVGFVLR
jgi:dihydrolipoamide dehydrogenase